MARARVRGTTDHPECLEWGCELQKAQHSIFLRLARAPSPRAIARRRDDGDAGGQLPVVRRIRRGPQVSLAGHRRPVSHRPVASCWKHRRVLSVYLSVSCVRGVHAMHSGSRRRRPNVLSLRTACTAFTSQWISNLDSGCKRTARADSASGEDTSQR